MDLLHLSTWISQIEIAILPWNPSHQVLPGIQVLLHQAPDPIVHTGFLGRIGHGGDGPKPRSVVLWTTPGARERRALGDQELGLNQHLG